MARLATAFILVLAMIDLLYGVYLWWITSLYAAQVNPGNLLWWIGMYALTFGSFAVMGLLAISGLRLSIGGAKTTMLRFVALSLGAAALLTLADFSASYYVVSTM